MYLCTDFEYYQRFNNNHISMSNFRLSAKQLSSHWLQIEARFETNGRKSMLMQLPSWRPGRYELGNFAKNVRGFIVTNEQNETLKIEKISKDSWEVFNVSGSTIKVFYEYYAAELNAGSTFIDEHQIYVNPVNCFLYDPENMDSACTLSLPDYGENWDLAIGLEKNSTGDLVAKDIHQLFDSPFIYGNKMHELNFDVKGATIHLWFHGICKPNYAQLQLDFTKFIEVQYDLFGSYAFEKAYHFLFHIVPYSAFHGVEHVNNTVIYLGPSYTIGTSTAHHSLLGISSHEFFHSWNVKTIRPTEMYPYNYARENYTQLGYVTEGFTTYYGDIMLWRSKVWNDEVYLNVLAALITKHVQNFGRFNYSVAESSFDTWLDGYQAGVPDRKTSIYTEGAMVALLLDLHIITTSEGKHSLDNVMRSLYTISAKAGYSEDDMKQIVSKYGGEVGLSVLQTAVYGREDLIPFITASLSKVGVELTMAPLDTCETKFGFKFMAEGEHAKVVAIYPGSVADVAGLVVGDLITRVNSIAIRKDFNEWFNYFEGEAIKLQVLRQGVAEFIDLPKESGTYYQKVILKSTNTNAFYSFWKNRN